MAVRGEDLSNRQDEKMDNKSEDAKDEVDFQYIDDLECKLCAYFSLADYHNLEIFKEIMKITDGDLIDEISNRLLYSLMFFEHIILHCSDPLRSEIIYKVLEKNKILIKERKIGIVFSDSFKSVTLENYKKYIEHRVTEYRKNKFSQKDLYSLNQPHMTEDYYTKVITLFDGNPLLLKRFKHGGDSNNIFREFIKEDLKEKNERIILRGTQDDDKLLANVELTLWQLLNATIEKGKKYEYLFNNDEIKKYIRNWNNQIDFQKNFSRHTIITELEQEMQIWKSKPPFEIGNTIAAINNRLSLLYSRMNCPYYVLSFDPKNEKIGLLDYPNIKLFIEGITGLQNIFLTPEKIINIQNNDNFINLQKAFLSCVGVWKAYSGMPYHDKQKFSDYIKYFISPDNIGDIVKVLEDNL